MATGISTTEQYRAALERYAMLRTGEREAENDRELPDLESDIATYLLTAREGCTTRRTG